MGHFSIGFLLGVAVGAYVAQEYEVPKVRFIYARALEKAAEFEKELRKSTSTETKQ